MQQLEPELLAALAAEGTTETARQLAAGGVDRDQAEVIADAIRQSIEQGRRVLPGLLG